MKICKKQNLYDKEMRGIENYSLEDETKVLQSLTTAEK